VLRLTQRRATLLLLLIEVAALALTLLLLPTMNLDASTRWGLLVAAPLFAAMAAAYWRGWDWVRYANLVLAVVLVSGPLIDPRNDRSFSPIVFAPPALAIVTADPWWVGGTALAVFLALLARGGGIYMRADNVISYALLISCMVIGRLIADQARRAAERTAAEVEHERSRVAEEARLRERQAAELAAQNAEQRRLLELVATLETPAVTLADGVLLAPLVGAFDARRLEALSGRLLRQVAAERIRLVVLDVAGLSLVEPALVLRLDATARALQLLGCKVALSGISPAMAVALTDQGVSFAEVLTVPSPREALALA
jgi:rsbT co-antagonist protein RsbR